MSNVEILNLDKKEPLVSIAMLAYNHEDFVSQAIDSVLMQETNFDYKIIIAEDYSTDKTRQIICEYQEKFPNKFKLILQNSNVGVNQNNLDLLSNLEGKYIAALEGDDYWTDPYKLQKQVDFLEANKGYSGCFHYTPMLFEDEPERKGRLFGFHGDKMDFTGEDTITTLSPWHTSSFLFRRNAFKLTPWFKEVVSGDMAVFSIVAKSGKIRCIPEEMSVYRKNEGGVTNTSLHKQDEYHKNRIKLMNYLNNFHEFKYKNRVNKVIDYHKNQLGKLVDKKETLNKGFYTKIKARIGNIYRKLKNNFN